MPDPPSPRKPPTATDHYESALEASCDALITLQLLQASAASSDAQVANIELGIHRATELVRCAIAELRLAQPERQWSTAIGFVLGTDPAEPESPASSTGQSKPRRTA